MSSSFFCSSRRGQPGGGAARRRAATAATSLGGFGLLFLGLLLGAAEAGGGGGGGAAATGVGLGASFLAGSALGVSLGCGLELLGVARALAQLGELAGAHQIDGDRLRLGHTQLPLRLDGEERPPQDRRVQQDGGDQSAPHFPSLAHDPSNSVTSETLVKPAALTRPITRITVP